MRSIIIAAALLLLLAPSARGWSTKEHIQLTRIAIERLIDDPTTPPDMKQWLRDSTPGVLNMDAERKWFMEQRQGIVPRGADGIAYWCVIPDTTVLIEGRGEEKKVEPFGVPERLLHYIDLELFVTGDQKREYRHDLSGKPKLENIPHDIKDPRYIQA